MDSFITSFITYARGVALGLRQLPTFRLSYFGKVFSFMGKREKIAAGILLGVAVVALIISLFNFYRAHTVLAPASGGVYVEGMVGQPVYINPLLVSSETDLSLEQLIYSGLYKYDASGKLVPDLADGMPQISDDQKQYTINLKHNVTWHNDQQFTADDVVFTVQTLQNAAYKSPLRPLWLSTTVEKLGEYQVKFTTQDVSGPFINNLTLPIMPQSVWQNVSPQLFLTSVNNLQAVGTGGYSIKEIQKEASGKIDQISLDSFANYYGGKPKIDSVIIKFYDTDDDMLNALHSKEIQGLGYTPADSSLHVDSGNGIQVLTASLPQYQVLFYNLNNKILGDVNVRQALSAAVDRQNIINSIFKGGATLPGSPFTFATAHFSGPQVTYDMGAAAAKLDAAGWELDPNTHLRTKKGATLTLNLATNDSLDNSNTAQAIADGWRALGVQVNLTVLPTQQLTDTLIRPRKFDALVFPMKLGPDPDPFAFWQSSQIKDPGLNLTGFSNPAADQLINQARSTTDTQTRESLYEQFTTLFNQQMPALFLNQAEYQYAIDSNIKNADLSILYDASDRFSGLPGWYLQEMRVWK